MKRTAVILLAAAALAGCGSGSSGSAGGTATAASSSSSAPTLYMFARDTKGKSNCNGACAQEWPPASAKAKAPSGADKKNLGTIKRSDGTKQLALSGKPLYTFSGDKQPGDRNGDGVNAFGGMWSAVGSPAKSSAPAPSPSYGGY